MWLFWHSPIWMRLSWLKVPCSQFTCICFFIVRFLFYSKQIQFCIYRFIFCPSWQFPIILGSLSHLQTFNLPKRVLLFIFQENSLLSKKFLFWLLKMVHPRKFLRCATLYACFWMQAVKTWSQGFQEWDQDYISFTWFLVC